jgi:hypothetical protein
MKKLLLICLLLLTSACTKIETGHSGVRVEWDGKVNPEHLSDGIHQTIIGHVLEYVTNEITRPLDGLKPLTSDRTLLSDLDLAYTYSVDPTYIAELVTKFKGRDLYDANEDIYYPLAAFMDNVVTTATSDVVANYKALDVNNNRTEIRDAIQARAAAILKEQGVGDKARVHTLFVKNLQIDTRLQDSALSIIRANNEYEAKKIDVQTAEQESQRLTLLANNSKSIDYMNAKSLSTIADAVLQGKVQSVIIPWDFKGIVNVK